MDPTRQVAPKHCMPLSFWDCRLDLTRREAGWKVHRGRFLWENLLVTTRSRSTAQQPQESKCLAIISHRSSALKWSVVRIRKWSHVLLWWPVKLVVPIRISIFERYMPMKIKGSLVDQVLQAYRTCGMWNTLRACGWLTERQAHSSAVWNVLNQNFG